MIKQLQNNSNAAENVFGVSDILEAQLRSNTIGATDQSDTPMTKIDRSTYGGLSNKTSKGTPNQYWVERFIDRTVMHVYPTPDSTNAGKHVHFFITSKELMMLEIIQTQLMYHLDLYLVWYQV